MTIRALEHTGPMTPVERARYGEIQTFLKSVKPTLDKAGMMLMEVRDLRLYRGDYDTFEAYCQDQWGMSRQRALQLINNAVVVQALPAPLTTMVVNERQARELAKAPESDRVAVLKRAISASNGHVTAKAIKEAIPATPKPVAEKPAAACDETEHRIPNSCRATWERRSEIQDLMSMVSKVKCAVEKGLNTEEPDPVFAHVRQSTITELEAIYTHLALSKPYALCPGCSGAFTVTKGCQQCHNSGFIGKRAWELVPPMIKKMRETNK